MSDVSQGSAESSEDFSDIWKRIYEDLSLREAQTLSAYVGECNVRAVGHDVNHGENKRCGEGGVQCCVISVSLPSDEDVVSIVREARNTYPNPSNWTADPYNGLGWCWFENQTITTQPDGRKVVAVTLKNWSENIARQARLTVYTSR